MGRVFKTASFRCSKDSLRKEFSEFQKVECFDRGHDYDSGHLGTLEYLEIKNKKFDSYDQAWDWLEENCEGIGGHAIAVMVKEKVNGISKAFTKYEANKSKLNDDLVSFKKQCFLDIKKAKSKTIGCKSCGSQISRAHLTSVDCPVCEKRDSFYSNTVKNRILGKENKLKMLKAPEKHTESKVDSYYWLVGGWCKE